MANVLPGFEAGGFGQNWWAKRWIAVLESFQFSVYFWLKLGCTLACVER